MRITKHATYAIGVLMLILSAPGFAGPNTDAISAAATAFLDTLDEAQRKTTTMPLDTDDRATWSNLPIVMVQPAGVLIKDMSDEQRRAAHALMRATMSSQGYAKFAALSLLHPGLAWGRAFGTEDTAAHVSETMAHATQYQASIIAERGHAIHAPTEAYNMRRHRPTGLPLE